MENIVLYSGLDGTVDIGTILDTANDSDIVVVQSSFDGDVDVISASSSVLVE